MKAVRILIFISSLLFPKLADAMTVGDYQQDLLEVAQDAAGQTALDAQVDGLINGIQAASAYYVLEYKAPRIFCEPPDLVITVSEEFQILNDWIKKSDPPANIPLSAAAIFALQYAFPCSP